MTCNTHGEQTREAVDTTHAGAVEGAVDSGPIGTVDTRAEHARDTGTFCINIMLPALASSSSAFVYYSRQIIIRARVRDV